MTNDQELARGMIEGREAAFDEFFREYAPRLYRFLLPRLRHDQQATEEVCQEVLARAMERVDRWRGEASLFTWICQMGRNEVIDHWRRRQHRQDLEVYIEDDPAIAAALDSIAADVRTQPDLQQSRDETMRLVHVALDRLPDSYGSALEWKYIDGCSVAEIAGRLGQSVIATQSLLARARNGFREAFASLAGGQLADVLPFTAGGPPRE